MSLITMLVLSYPTFTKFRLSSNSPISVHRSDKLHPDPVDRPPEWLRNSPTTFVQQIIIRGGVEPWISQHMTTDQAIRGPLSRAFLAREIVLSDKVVDEFCFQINRDGAQSESALHQDGCLLLDPTAFWQSSIDSFREDPDVLTTIFSRECSTVMCPRDLFLGIDFSLTLFLVQYDHDMRNALLERLTSDGNFVSVPLPAEEQSHFIHVFYRQRKAFGDYLPLLSSYAVFTIPRFSAVVYTPPSLDVSSRISHGLAQEGYSLCKYFVMELLFLAVGYATRIAEIQEFCMFAFIGLVIDFYMQVRRIHVLSAYIVRVVAWLQMFFYAPCLTFDLQRLSPEEKRKFALKLFHADIPHLHEFVPVRCVKASDLAFSSAMIFCRCPMRKLWPSFFRMERAKKRTLSESQLDERDLPEDPDRKGRGRSNSVTNTDWTYDAAHMDRNHASTMSDGLDASHPLFGSTRPQWEMWSERTFKWQYIAVCGCADGSLEVACLERNKLIGVYLQSRIGIVHVLFVGSRVVLARLDGSVEFLELTLTTERKPISLLSCSSLTAISASYDHTLKLFDLRTCQLQSMLHAHSGPVTSICTDHVTNTLFTACEQGVICWWNMSSGELLRSLDIGCTGRTQLACSADYLLGYASEGDFFLWSKDDGSLVSRIAQHHTKKDAAFVSRSLVALGDQLAVTASEFTLTFWDLQHKAIIHQVRTRLNLQINSQVEPHVKEKIVDSAW
ncbi:unnamed protein product [Nippostrongylus brasiliensis]|uniref:Sterol regulatory element-binding protein cleavage-activating protein n=1 Tax=Nippostrongylus brasiliensis TaxID=27835 RepID=A0A158R0X5_NIPBR|nr:unnamed protein product [Nippostrongylus brasiliensis]